LVLVGSILLGAVMIYARVLPWWCGVLLIAGFPLGAVLETVRWGDREHSVLDSLGVDRLRSLARRGTVAEQQPSRVC
jgi:hypothetical protein